jgi:hypothetical protein
VSHARNARAGDDFVRALTAKRAGRAVPAPLVNARYQAALRQVAVKLQDGTISAERARQAADEWGQRVYHGAARTWVLDCAKGADLPLPPELLASPTAVLTYAPAEFRPRSFTRDQCAIVVVASSDAHAVVMKPLGTP